MSLGDGGAGGGGGGRETGQVVGSRFSKTLFLMFLYSAHAPPPVPRCTETESTGERTLIGNLLVEMVTRNRRYFSMGQKENECRGQWPRGRDSGMVVS